MAVVNQDLLMTESVSGSVGWGSALATAEVRR
jgi:hypothetical protein